MDDLFPSEEREIIKAEKAAVAFILYESFGKKLLGEMLIGGAVGQYLRRRRHVKTLTKSDVSGHTDLHTRYGLEYEYGDFGDITDNFILVQPLTLTNRNLILWYKKGFTKKRNLALAVPTEHFKSVQEKKILGVKSVLIIRFEARAKEGKVLSFDIFLRDLSDSKTWLDKLNQLIGDRSRSDRSPA